MNSIYRPYGVIPIEIIGGTIFSVSFECKSSGFYLVITVPKGSRTIKEYFFSFDRENLDFVRPMQLVGKQIKSVEWCKIDGLWGTKIVTTDGYFVWLQQDPVELVS